MGTSERRKELWERVGRKAKRIQEGDMKKAKGKGKIKEERKCNEGWKDGWVKGRREREEKEGLRAREKGMTSTG